MTGSWEKCVLFKIYLTENQWHLFLFSYFIIYCCGTNVGSDGYFICTTNWTFESPLGFKKWSVCSCSSLILTIFLKNQHLPSIQPSTLFVNFISNIAFLTSSTASAKTGPSACADFVSCKKLKESVLYLFLNCHFFAMLGVLSIPLFFSLK